MQNLNDNYQKIIEHNTIIEKSLLGSIILNNELINEVSFLEPFYFSNLAHQEIFKCMRTNINNNLLVDAKIIVGSLMSNTTLIKDINDIVEYVNIILSHATLGPIAKSYAVSIVDNYKRVFIKKELDNWSKSLMENSIEDTLLAIEKTLRSNDVNDFNINPILNAEEVANRSMAAVLEKSNPKTNTNIQTGITGIDLKLEGFIKGNLVIIAGRTSMGKTALALTMALNMMRRLPVAIFSLEMSATEIGSRAVAQLTNMSLNTLAQPNNINHLQDGVNTLSSLNMFIYDGSLLSINALCQKARFMHKKHNIEVIIVDYLQLLESDNAGRGSRTSEIGDITRKLKTLAKELNVVVIALSQLSRAVEMREDKKPMLSDLRESGSIEQDADIVGFIFREEYYRARTIPTSQDNKESQDAFNARVSKARRLLRECEGKATLIIAKNRHGETGEINLAFNKHTATFTNTI